MHFEILCAPAGVKYSNKASAWIAELCKHRPATARAVSKADGRADCLICYGPTSSASRQAIKRYQEKMWVALDLGYWDRCRDDYPMRVSINSAHPDEHLEDFGPARWDRRKVELRDDHDRDGHILVAGMGRKTAANAGCGDWDRNAQARAVRHWGARRVVFRPKPANRLVNLQNPVQDALRGAAYLVTRHSNVGVDAVLQGVPVATDFGAVRWLYGSGFDQPPAPYEKRLDFVRRLAWWNWRRSEIPEFWRFIMARVHERVH